MGSDKNLDDKKKMTLLELSLQAKAYKFLDALLNEFHHPPTFE